MSTHDCPRIYPSKHGVGLMTVDNSKHCAVCEETARKRYEAWLPYLGELRDWLEDGGDPSPECWQMLYERYTEDMPYGFQTGDTGTIDEWLSDRPDRIEELIATIEHYHPTHARQPA